MKNIIPAIILVFMIVSPGVSLVEAIPPPFKRVMLPLDPKEWTFMVYLDADNDLEVPGILDFYEMASVGSTADINIIVQFDRIDGYSESDGNWTDCRRYYITLGITPTAENALFSLGEVNMGDPLSLIDFMNWTITQYPAEKYILVLWDHGNFGSVCVDETDLFDYLTSIEIYTALETVMNATGERIDILGAEACMLSSIEMAYHSSQGAEIMVASEDVIAYMRGWPFDNILAELAATPTMNSTTLALRIFDHFVPHNEGYGLEVATFSVFNLTKVALNLTPAVSLLADRLNQTVTTYLHDIIDAIERTSTVYPAYFNFTRDLYRFAEIIEDRIPDTAIQEAAQNVMNALNESRLAEWHDVGKLNFYGLSIYLPATENSYSSSYNKDNSEWTSDTSWGKLLYTLFVTYAPSLLSRETLSDISYTTFDSDADDYLDAIHISLDADTTGETLNTTVHGRLIDPSDQVVDTCVGWTEASLEDVWCNLDLLMPPGGEEGWYDVELILYDEYGALEDYLYSNDLAYLPEVMQHDVAINDVTVTQTAVGQGFPAKINVIIANLGHFTETFNVTIHANGTLVNSTQLTLTSENIANYTVHWDTTAQTIGNYSITVQAEVVSGETNTTDNTLIADSEVCITIPGDVDADLDVDIFDIVTLADAYGSNAGEPEYFANGDIDGDGDIDIFDIVLAASNYGLTEP